MMLKNWNTLLTKENDRFTCSVASVNAELIRMENVTKIKLTAPVQQLLFVVQGECDVLYRGGRYRLTLGSWINIPADEPCAVHVFRTCESCVLLRVECPVVPAGTVCCNVFDMIPMDGSIYFAGETNFLTGICCNAPMDDLAVLTLPVGNKFVSFCSGEQWALYASWLETEKGILWSHGVNLGL